jgi:glycosyltransferase involved in cell wall biosynthesis
MIRDLAARCLSDGISCQFVVCGDGDQAPAVRALLSGLPNVILPGWIDRPKIKTLYDSTAAIVAPYRSNDAFDRSVPNKIVDALAAGLGVVASLDGVTARLVDRYRLGKTSPSAEILYKELVRIVEDQQYRDSVHAAALSVYEQHFSFHAVYDGLARRVESLRCP